MKQYLRETHSDSLRWPLGNISSPRHIFNPYIYLFSTPISKTNQPIYLKSFIALIGKDFLWRLCNTYESFMLRNKYTDTSVQKGEIPGISSYVEHTSALTHLLNKARTSHKNLTLVWLDLANAYGYITHQLIQVAMYQYYIPDHLSNLIMNYFNNNHLRFSNSRFTTSSFKKVLSQGCFIFVKLFVMV